MFKNTDDENRIFRDESVLLSDHDSIEPIGREDEIDKIASSLEPLSHRRKPENLLVYGPSGVGKTTCVNHVFQNLEAETRVKTVWINCWQYNTRPSLLTELLVQLGYPAPRKGKPVDELLSKLCEWLDKNRCIAVALDEFDQMNGETEIAYDLQLLNENADNQLGVVMISNQPSSKIELDPRSQSRLDYQTIEFQSYTRDELVTILKDRVEKAFYPGTVSDTTLERIAELNSDDEGDCRKAIAHLLRAGRMAEREGHTEIIKKVIESTYRATRGGSP